MNAQSQSTFLLLRHLELPRALSVLLAFVLITLTLNSRVLGTLSSHYLGGAERDAGLYIWLSTINSESFFDRSWFSTPAFFPYGKSLAWSDNFILPSLLIWFLGECGLNICASYNLILLSAFVLNGFFTFLLCHTLTNSLLSSFFAGCAFMTLSFLRGHLGHPQLQFAFWIPLFSLYCLRFIAHSRKRDIVAAALCILGAFLTCVYYSLFLVFAGITLFGALLLLRPHLFQESSRWKKGAAGFLVLPFVIPFLLPYLETKSAFGPRFLHEAAAFSASALSYFSAPNFNWLYGNTSALSHSEAQLLPGIIVLMLSLCAVARLVPTASLRPRAFLLIGLFVFTAFMSVAAVEGFLGTSVAHYLCAIGSWSCLGFSIVYLYHFGAMEKSLGMTIITNRALIGIFAFSALVSFLTSLGPCGFPEEGTFALGVHRLFYNIIPGFDAVRAVGRMGVLTDFYLIVLASIALAYFAKLLGYPRLLASIAIVGTLLENYHVDYPLEELPRTPPIFSKLESLPETGNSFIVLPYSGEVDKNGKVKSWSIFSQLHVNYMNWSKNVPLPLVNGYSGQRTRLMLNLNSQLSRFPDLPSVKAISQIAGLRYIVFIPSLSSSPDAYRVVHRIGAFSDSLVLRDRDAQGNLLIEYIGTRNLDVDGAYLLAPSSPPGELLLELSAAPQTGEPKIPLIPVIDAAGAKITLPSLLIPASGRWEMLRLKLPQGVQSVQPFKIQLRPQPGSAPPRSLSLRSSEFIIN